SHHASGVAKRSRTSTVTVASCRLSHTGPSSKSAICIVRESARHVATQRAALSIASAGSTWAACYSAAMTDQRKRRIVVAITGATGAVFGVRVLEELRRVGNVESHVVISKAGALSASAELGLSRREIEALGDTAYSERDIGAAIASGSFQTDGMIVAPCSMRTLAAVATGVTDNLVTRAAD